MIRKNRYMVLSSVLTLAIALSSAMGCGSEGTSGKVGGKQNSQETVQGTEVGENVQSGYSNKGGAAQDEMADKDIKTEKKEDLTEEDLDDEVVITQSDGPAPPVKEGYCYLENSEGDIMGRFPVPEDIVKLEIMAGGSTIHYVYDPGDSHLDESYLYISEHASMKSEKDFFLFETDAEYGDLYEKEYFGEVFYDEITKEPQESELKTELVGNLEFNWKTTEYGQNGKDYTDVDGYCNVDESSSFVFHSRGPVEDKVLEEDKILEIVKAFEKEFIRCPNIRNNTMYVENYSGIECFSCPLPDNLSDFMIISGGSTMEWKHAQDTKYYILEASVADTLEYEKSNVEEFDIDNPIWETYQGKYLSFEYTIGKVNYSDEGRNTIIALTESDGNVLRVEIEFDIEDREKAQQEFFLLLDQIEGIRTASAVSMPEEESKEEDADNSKDAGTDEDAEAAVDSSDEENTWEKAELPLVPEEGYCIIDDLNGNKIGQVRIPEDNMEVNISSGGTEIEFIRSKYRSYILKSDMYLKSKEDLIEIGADLLKIEEPVCKEEHINGMNTVWLKSGSRIYGAIWLPKGAVEFDVQGYEEEDVMDLLSTIKPMSVAAPNIRDNTAYIENQEGIEVVLLPLTDEMKVEIGAGGNIVNILTENMICNIKVDSLFSLDEEKDNIDSVLDSNHKHNWENYKGNGIEFDWTIYFQDLGDRTEEYLIAYGEYEEGLICVEAQVGSSPSMPNDNINDEFFRVLDALTLVR